MALFAIACSKVETEPGAPAPSVHTVRAGFAAGNPETRSRLDFGETQARVLWSRGDAFRMLAYSPSDGKLYGRTYTTQDDGVTQAEFTASSALSGRFFASGYPASSFGRVGSHDTEDDSFVLITPVPSNQEAVPGGVAEGLNLAASWSTTPDADLHFYNLLSMVRFRLDGDVVPSLTSVVFDAMTTVAGQASAYLKDGEPVMDFSHNWSENGVPRSTTITLSGTFQEGQDYCIALVPAHLPGGFNMVFRDGEGHELFKHSSKALTLGRGRIVDFGTVHLGDSWEEEHTEVIEYVRQTAGRKKNVIAVLAEGYTEQELDLFEVRAKSGIDYLFNTEPFKSYKEYFTVYLFRAVSNESGASISDGSGNIVTAKDTRFGAYWGEDSYDDMRADTAKIRGFLRENCPEILAGELRDRDVPALLLVNDERYGGRCISNVNGWGYCLVPFQKNGLPISWGFPNDQAVNPRDDSEGSRKTTAAERDAFGRHTGDWRNTLLHEFGGHCYSRLADEYWGTSFVSSPSAISYHSWAIPYALNVSGLYDSVPWKSTLLDHLDEWVDLNPDYGRTGIYQGASSSLYFRWRSEPVSCMIDNRPYFNTWSRILIVRRILEKAGEAFDLEMFKAKDVTCDPVRPPVDASPAMLRQRAREAALVPVMPMLLPPVLEED